MARPPPRRLVPPPRAQRLTVLLLLRLCGRLLGHGCLPVGCWGEWMQWLAGLGALKRVWKTATLKMVEMHKRLGPAGSGRHLAWHCCASLVLLARPLPP